MFTRQTCRPLRLQLRHYTTTTTTTDKTRVVPTLPDTSLETFRKHAFEPALPALLPKGSQAHIPAISKWFIRRNGIADFALDDQQTPLRARDDDYYLSRYYGFTTVPIEVIHDGKFDRLEQKLAFFIEFVTNCDSIRLDKRPDPRDSSSAQGPSPPDLPPLSASTNPNVRMYLAQAPLTDFPPPMQAEVPTPEIVLQAGKGDVYDSSLWLGKAPTYTPLHRDPNPNLFVQLAGRKVVRLYEPRKGNAVFSKVQEQIGGSASATMRGEEMMQGKEKEALEEEVWGEGEARMPGVWQAELDAGDALFIPKGWWHSVKGIGEGINGSVNWWFR